MSYRLIAAAAALVALAGCASRPPPPPPAEDFNVGIAKTCTATPITTTPGGTASATVTMTNDGWCAVRAVEADKQPFLLGLVRQRPDHGVLLVRKLGGETRLEYNPHPGYTGADAFSVALRSKDPAAADSLVQVAVTVSQGAGVAAAPPPPPAPEKPTTTSTRRTTRHPARRTTP